MLFLSQQDEGGSLEDQTWRSSLDSVFGPQDAGPRYCVAQRGVAPQSEPGTMANCLH